MIDATSTCFGKACLILRNRPIHQSMGLSEISSQFHDAMSVESGRLAIDSRPSPSVRRNFVFGPLTLTTGCMPIVLVTTPPQPASKARMMFASDSVGGAEASMKGFSKRMPVNVVDRSAMGFLLCREAADYTRVRGGWVTDGLPARRRAARAGRSPPATPRLRNGGPTCRASLRLQQA